MHPLEISALVQHSRHVLPNVSDARVKVLKVRLRLLDPVVVLRSDSSLTLHKRSIPGRR